MDLVRLAMIKNRSNVTEIKLSEWLSRSLVLPCGAVIPNRIVKSAMSEGLASAEGEPSERLCRLYRRFGKGGAGLLITGNAMIDPGGLGEPGNVLLGDERHLSALKRWAEAGQEDGARVWVQLNHAGRQSPKVISSVPVAPSSVPMRGFFGAFARARALEDHEIEALVRRFAAGASLAKEAGFSGVQVHGAHGYLVSQFLSPLTNLRTDRWGGALDGRMRFLLEVVRAIRSAVGPNFPVGVKLNSADFQRGGFESGDALLVAQALEQERVDLLEVSGGTYESPAMTGFAADAAVRESSKQREAYFLEYAVEIRKAVKTPLLLTGGFRTAAGMTDALRSGAVDLVGLARPLCLEPELPRQILAGERTSATPVDLRTGFSKLDGTLPMMWSQAQIRRMADGLEPDPKLGRLAALLSGLRRLP